LPAILGVAAVARESSASAVRAGAVYFPFRRKFYADAGVPVKFIGHPLVGNVKPTMTREFFCKEYGLDERNKILTILREAAGEKSRTTCRC